MAQTKSAPQIPDLQVADPEQVAKDNNLRYVTDGKPGIQRRKAGSGFSYTGLDGKPIRKIRIPGPLILRGSTRKPEGSAP